jgi:hypothetical protein
LPSVLSKEGSEAVSASEASGEDVAARGMKQTSAELIQRSGLLALSGQVGAVGEDLRDEGQGRFLLTSVL